MILENNIGWCDVTGNKITGCQKVSPECDNCYAEFDTVARVLRHRGIETWGPKATRNPIAGFSAKVRRLNKSCICDVCHETAPFHFLESWQCPRMDHGCVGRLRRIRIFADSNSDWLDLKWPIWTFADYLKDIHDCPNIDFQLLTKRTQNFLRRVEAAQDYHFDHGDRDISGWLQDWRKHGIAPQNVWIGGSLVNGTIPEALLSIPARVRFVSAEPLLKPMVLRTVQIHNSFPQHITAQSQAISPSFNIHWAIVGLESGKNRRDCGVQVLIDAVNQFVQHGIPVYCKQDCALKSGQQGRIPNEIWKLKDFPNVSRRPNHEILA